jgi:hypothetical protein
MPPKHCISLIKILDVAWPNKSLGIATNWHLATLLTCSVISHAPSGCNLARRLWCMITWTHQILIDDPEHQGNGHHTWNALCMVRSMPNNGHKYRQLLLVPSSNKEGTGKSKFLPCCLTEHSSWDGMSSGSCQKNKNHWWSGRLLHQKLKSAEFLDNAGHVGVAREGLIPQVEPIQGRYLSACKCAANQSYRGMQTRPPMHAIL